MIQTQFFPLRSITIGSTLFTNAELAYESYGELNADKSNAILLFHALSGSQHAHGMNPSVEGVGDLWKKENHEGWWDYMIGEGKPLDTGKYFIICVNYLGSCYGSTGPMSICPEDDKPWGSRFPWVSAADQAHAHIQLLDSLGIEKLQLVGPSVGGLIALSFAVLYPDRVKGVVSIGSGYKSSIEHQLSLFEQICAIELDGKFCDGRYDLGDPPLRGLALARIIGHKSFVYQEGLSQRARAVVGQSSDLLCHYAPKSNAQSYMIHQGEKFAKRFDANAYIRIADMWASFDICTQQGVESFAEAIEPIRRHNIPFLIFSIDSDACFRPQEQEDFAVQLANNDIPTQLCLIESIKGHDSFLLEPELYAEALAMHLEGSID